MWSNPDNVEGPDILKNDKRLLKTVYMYMYIYNRHRHTHIFVSLFKSTENPFF